MKKIISLLMLSFIILQLTGCASGPLLRADSGMLEKNPMQKIALIGAGTVYWPRMGGNSPAVGLKSSMSGIEKVLPMVKSHLEAKGYTIAFADPIAAGLPFKNHETHPMFADYENKGDDSAKPDLLGDDPGHVYKVSNPEVSKAGIALSFELIDSIADRKIASYSPSQSNIQTVLNATGADTLCQVRAYGIRYSSGRAVGAFFLALLTGSMANTHDWGELGLICSNSEGKVLWQDFHRINDDPMAAEADDISKTLKLFPLAGVPLPKTCKANPEKAEHYSCEEDDA